MRTMALMQVADRRLEMAEREVPAIGRDAGLLEVEACGLCGSDVEQFKGNFVAKGLVRYPLIPGHEPIGRIGGSYHLCKSLLPIRLRGVFTQARPAYEQAIALLSRSPGRFARLHTHDFPLERTAEAIETLAGERGEGAICISIHP